MKNWIFASAFLFWGMMTISAQDFVINLENTTLHVESVAQELDIPWDMVWGPDGHIWFSERVGNIKRLNPQSGEVELIYYEEECDPYEEENAGMHAFSLHPQFPAVPYMYAHYPTSLYVSKLRRYELDVNTNTVLSFTDLMEFGANSSHNGSRIVWDNDESFFFCLGDAYTSLVFPQNPDNLNGKVLRIGMNGEIPSDNPNPQSYVYTLGHRNPQGLVKADNGVLYSSEHGTFVDDEINIILPGRNYGWPYSLGPCDVFDAEELEFCLAYNVVEPIWWWNPTEAPAGLDYYNHEAIPEWQNSLILGMLKGRHFKVLPLADDGLSILEEQQYLANEIGRIRDILVAPDGSVYFCTSDQEPSGFPLIAPEDDQIFRIFNPEYTHVLEKKKVAELKIFPNPADEYVQIIPPAFGSWDIQIFDQMGRLLLSNSVRAAQLLELSTIDLKPGSYIVKMIDLNGGSSANGRFIVNHQN